MNIETLVIQQARLASLIGGMGYPNPDDDSPKWTGPHGPGPVARSWLDVLCRITLNPQPLPPKEFFATAIANVFIERATLVCDLGTLLTDKQRSLSASFATEFDDVGGWCGTMGRWDLMQKILTWLRHYNPPPPPPDFWWKQGLTPNEMILVGGRLAFAAESFGDSAIRSALKAVGGDLMQHGLRLGQTYGNRQTIPVAEQVGSA